MYLTKNYDFNFFLPISIYHDFDESPPILMKLIYHGDMHVDPCRAHEFNQLIVLVLVIITDSLKRCFMPNIGIGINWIAIANFSRKIACCIRFNAARDGNRIYERRAKILRPQCEIQPPRLTKYLIDGSQISFFDFGFSNTPTKQHRSFQEISKSVFSKIAGETACKYGTHELEVILGARLSIGHPVELS